MQMRPSFAPLIECKYCTDRIPYLNTAAVQIKLRAGILAEQSSIRTTKLYNQENEIAQLFQLLVTRAFLITFRQKKAENSCVQYHEYARCIDDIHDDWLFYFYLSIKNPSLVGPLTRFSVYD